MDAVTKGFLDTLVLRSLDVQERARSLAKRTFEMNLVREPPSHSTGRTKTEGWILEHRHELAKKEKE